MAAVKHDGSAFCIEVVDEAIAWYGKPEIFNTDQGCQLGFEKRRTASWP